MKIAFNALLKKNTKSQNGLRPFSIFLLPVFFHVRVVHAVLEAQDERQEELEELHAEQDENQVETTHAPIVPQPPQVCQIHAKPQRTDQGQPIINVSFKLFGTWDMYL